MLTRRQILASGAALLAAPYVQDRKLSTAIIGPGWWGKNILREAMASGRCKVVGAADVDPTALQTTLVHGRVHPHLIQTGCDVGNMEAIFVVEFHLHQRG